MLKAKEVFYVTYVERDEEKFNKIVEDIAAFWNEQKESGVDVEHDEYHSDAPCDFVSKKH